MHNTYLLTKYDSTTEFCYFIDSPKDKLISTKEEILVRGWVLPAHPDHLLSIFIKEDGVQRQVPFNQPRPDVIKHFKEKYHFNDPLCGFAISLANFSEVEISIKTNNQLTRILKLEKANPQNGEFYYNLDKLIESFENGTYKLAKFKPTQKNKLSEIYLWQEKQDIQSIANYICDTINSNEFCLPHPLNPEIKTYAKYSSIHKSGTNYILFSDISLSNLWCLAQEENFIDTIFTNDLALEFSTQKDGLIKNFTKSNIEYPQHNLNDPQTNIPFLLHHSRPYHFFYDYLKYLYYIISTKKLSHPPLVYTQSPFLPLEILGDKISVNIKKPKLLISPTLVATARIKRTTGEGNTALGKSELYKSITQSTEELIYKSFDDKNLLQDKFDLKIWIGISAEKRKWIEQIDGYAKIISELSNHYKKILILADGLTAPHSQKLSNTADMTILDDIRNLVTNKDTQFISLIGEDYATKIKYCKHIDIFISDAGTGCMIPLRICKKPGVLFSNKTLFTFPDDYPNTIKIINKEHITDIINHNKTADFVSYSIDWKNIYKEVCSITRLIQENSLRKQTKQI